MGRSSARHIVVVTEVLGVLISIDVVDRNERLGTVFSGDGRFVLAVHEESESHITNGPKKWGQANHVKEWHFDHCAFCPPTGATGFPVD
jgi:hypothetical protein